MQDLQGLLEKVTSPGDVATVLIAGTLGFGVDAVLNLIGVLSPGEIGLLSASGALGVKKAVQARVDANRRAARSRVPLSVEDRARAVVELLDEHGALSSRDALKLELQLHKQKLNEEQDLQNAINAGLAAVRDAIQRKGLEAPKGKA